MGAVFPGERADEETHGETDAGDQGHAIKGKPARTARPLAEPKFDGQRGRPEDAQLLAEEEPQRHAARNAAREIAEADIGEGEAGIGKTEERHDEIGGPGVQAMLHLAQRRAAVWAADGQRQRRGHAGQGGVDPGFEH